MPSALGHLKVIDFSDTISGQYCSRLLADFGAQVVIVEPPAGSAVRRLPPFANDGDSLYFFHLNTGKRSLAIDLSSDKGMADLTSLVVGADVVVVPPGYDCGALQLANESAVFVDISNFGTDGPYSDWKGPEIVHQALSGMMYNNGECGREPLYGVANRAALAASVGAYVGVLAALYTRKRSGAGQSVRVQIAETAAAMCFPYVVQHIYNGTVRARSDQAIPAGQVLCDGGWVCIWIYNHRWKDVLEVVRLPELENDPRFCEPVVRRQNWDALFALIQKQVVDWNAEDLVERLQQAQVIAAKAYRPSEQFANRHLNARGYWSTLHGKRPVLGPPFSLSATPRVAVTDAPQLNDRQIALEWPKKSQAQLKTGPSVPLSGLRVIELTTAWAGPMAGRILGFFGAQCIHVESPNRVNSWRLNKEASNPINFPDGKPGDRPFDRAFLFNSQNINKLSCTLNLKTQEGRDALRKLVAQSDVLICNFRPGTLKKLGLDYDSLKAIKSDIIVAELPAFGISGPMSGYAALGPTMEMATGMSAMIGYKDHRPETTGPSYMDPIGGFNAAAAILTALIHRQNTGEGQHIEVPQVEAAMQLIGPELLKAIETGIDPERNGNRSPYASPHDAFPAAGQDQWIAIAAEDNTGWLALCRLMGCPELALDPRFKTLADRKDNEDALTALVAEWTRDKDKHDLAEQLQKAGIAAAPVNNPRDLALSTYLAHRGFFTELDHPFAGRHNYPTLPIVLSDTPGGQHSAAPGFGYHNQFVLHDILALDNDEIAKVRERAMMTDTPQPGA
ncbi:CaiB/BaiF CoA transferase family protein [Pelagibacterium lentulum]|uniref:CoA transferase n=1 Tax=Pelagibacterium lentulum TaxID=2029865 RepID=A0A916R670_9HYPH|nr:CoA transferase [Pelagibacterium lentulum]GGA40379.1 CoA transferase [Pelagibacterium lentulum]